MFQTPFFVLFPETFGPHRRPIVEFAIENILTLKKLQERWLGAGQNNIDGKEVSNEGKKHKRRDKKSRTSKDQQTLGDGRLGSIDETKEKSTVDVKGHHNPVPDAKRRKSRPGVTHTEDENLPGKKRKRNIGRNLNSFEGDLDMTHKRPAAKMQKLPKGNAKEEISPSPILSENGKSRKKADGFKQVHLALSLISFLYTEPLTLHTFH